MAGRGEGFSKTFPAVGNTGNIVPSRWDDVSMIRGSTTTEQERVDH